MKQAMTKLIIENYRNGSPTFWYHIELYTKTVTLILTESTPLTNKRLVPRDYADIKTAIAEGNAWVEYKQQTWEYTD